MVTGLKRGGGGGGGVGGGVGGGGGVDTMRAKKEV